MNTQRLDIGIDVGSTTTKTAVLEQGTDRLLYSSYERHGTAQLKSVGDCLKKLREKFHEAQCRLILTGSGAKSLADRLKLPYIQEVVANSLAIRSRYPQARTAIELGGQDAKIIFFRQEEGSSLPTVSDMRMNGSCAGGTGAFLDEMASVLRVPVEELNGLAEKGTTVYDISGRCGVYAKTDIQPLLNQGVSRENLALSTFHAIAKQTIGGLAQGTEIAGPVIFEGGPLTFNPRLAEVFAERLNLSKEEVLRPERPEMMMAWGAALSLKDMEDSCPVDLGNLAEKLDDFQAEEEEKTQGGGPVFFRTEEEKHVFLSRHPLAVPAPMPAPGTKVRAYLGMDSGSTTTKFVLMGEDEEILYTFYASNEGDPLAVAKQALIHMRDAFKNAGAELTILGAGSTGYGEMMFARAFGTEYHGVETVAHARAAARYVKDATFLLDIGGQDMKAIWMDRGVITNILVNEACSSGCGSFLENFARSLHIPAGKIAELAFSSKNPAILGSRCTVFMNSSIVTAQRNGKQPEDIMAGLCRSVIENVFTKVIRVSNLDSLGDRIVVQGGTFQNDAVLRAMEQYLGREVTRAPYPGMMGAIGAALLTKEEMEAKAAAGEEVPHTFVDLEHLEAFAYSQEENSPCPHCGNHCRRTILRFSNGNSWVTNNRCERGEILDPEPQVMETAASAADGQKTEKRGEFAADGQNTEKGVLSALGGQKSGENGESTAGGQKSGKKAAKKRPVDLFALRERLLMKRYPLKGEEEPAGNGKSSQENIRQENGQKTAAYGNVRLGKTGQEDASGTQGRKKTVIGLPRVLDFWDTMPFWTTFFRALGFEVKISDASTRAMYESGLSAIPSDTVCFPAKLVHGHLRNLVKYGVDRIFFPSISIKESENREKTSESMCAVVKGYPLVIQNSDKGWLPDSVILDTPMFFWPTRKDKQRQLEIYMKDTFGIGERETKEAMEQGERAMEAFRRELKEAARRVLDEVKEEGGFAVILASRPYQNDSLVNHRLPQMFTSQGIPVLTADSVPGAEEVKLDGSRLDIVNNYHARMLSTAVLAAESPYLEYVQIGSFGCGHDAYLSDEIVRLMREISGKTPLFLKLDESDIQGPLRIRVRSFLETLRMRRREEHALEAKKLRDPYPVKFTQKDKKERVVLVPNTSHAFSRIMSAAMAGQGLRAVPLEIGRDDAIACGKRYVHNDICFPAQIVIGEAISALKSGAYDPNHTAIAMGKYIGDCRLTHYSELLRKALDDAGFPQVPILTNDDKDDKDLHPGFKMNLVSALRIAFSLPMIDALEELLRKIRPYETVPGSADAAFERGMTALETGLREHGVAGAKKGFSQAIREFQEVSYDRSQLKPRVLIVGEYLLNFHPGANGEIERYLEKNGFEIIEARMTDVIRKTYFSRKTQVMEYRLHRSAGEKLWLSAADRFFDLAHDMTDKIASAHPLYEPPCRMPDLVKESDPVIYHTFDTGEGVLIPAEILHHAKKGCRAFVILQPFGCLPNHIVGRGIVKKLKERYPDAQILSLDYDPDVSFANVENRLQMLIMNAKQKEAFPQAGGSS